MRSKGRKKSRLHFRGGAFVYQAQKSKHERCFYGGLSLLRTFGTLCPEAAGFREAPQQVFSRPLGAVKISSAPTLELLAGSAEPKKALAIISLDKSSYTVYN